jgi:hypothetical protein
VEDREARARIAALVELVLRHDRDITAFLAEFVRLDADIGRLASEVSQMRSGPTVQNLSADVTRQQSDVAALKTKVAQIAPPVGFESLIISHFPSIFEEF